MFEPSDASRGRHRQVPPHIHGSAHYYNMGCRHAKCRAAANESKNRFRRNRRAERVLDPETGRLIHPALQPIDSNLSARHGTAYGRRSYGCQCEACRAATRSSNGALCFGPLFLWHPTWTTLGAAIITVLMVCRAQINPLLYWHHQLRRWATHLWLFAEASPVTFVIALVAVFVAFVLRRHGRHHRRRVLAGGQWAMR